MTVSSKFFTAATLLALSGLGAFAQSVISVHSGVLQFSEGDVYADEKAINQKLGTFPNIKEKSILRTEMGRAEVLLTPGVFLRVGENSSIKMLDNRLSDTRVELLTGQAVVEADDPMKINSVTIVYKDYLVHVRKMAVLEFQTNPDQLKVYYGEAEVESNGSISVIKAGRLMPFTAAIAQEKFDAKTTGDTLTRWSEQRSEYVSVANVSAAKSLSDSGGSWQSSSWYYNPYYSMYTYVPMNGTYWNPYGYGFFSPYTVGQVYSGYGYGGGYGGNSARGTTTYSARPRSTMIGGTSNVGTSASAAPSFGRTSVASSSPASTSSFGGFSGGGGGGTSAASAGSASSGGGGHSVGGGRSR